MDERDEQEARGAEPPTSKSGTRKANARQAPGTRYPALRVKQDQRAWKYIHEIAATSSENLNRIAIRDGVHTYTYGLMFREWERYASVFSALGMTGESHARVGILASIAPEVGFCIYALNMVGAEVSIVSDLSCLKTSRIIQTIREEHLTDFIVTDDLAQPTLVTELLTRKEELGMRNVILLHVPIGGPAVNSLLHAAQEAKYQSLRGWFGPICMDQLLRAYGSHPVSYASDEGSATSFIVHTSGTTSGKGKSIPLSDAAFNAGAVSLIKVAESGTLPLENAVSCVSIDLSNAYAVVTQLHVPLAMGAEVAFVPGGCLNPDFHKAISAFRVSFLFGVGAMIEHWAQAKDQSVFDFSSVRCVALGGAAVSAHDKHRYYDFLSAHGAHDPILLNGYGVSEIGGACCLSTADLDDESIGHLLPGVELRLYDEERQRFYAPRRYPAEGLLYLSSRSVATPTLDGEQVVDVEMINNKPFVCTNDVVRVNADRSLTYLGRANRFLLNDDGAAYDAGRVETEVARQAGIESCAVVPVYHKWTHDSIPQLCVKPLPDAGEPEEVVRQALLQAFVTEEALTAHELPHRVLIAAELPRNANGKVDLYRITHGDVEGTVFELKAKLRHDHVHSIKLVPLPEDAGNDMIKIALGAIADDMKTSLPFGTKDSEDQTMNQSFNPIDGFNAMNQMGNQAMSMLFAAMNPAGQQQAQASQQAQAAPFPGCGQAGMPQLPNIGQLLGGALPCLTQLFDATQQAPGAGQAQATGFQMPGFQMPNFQTMGFQMPNFQNFQAAGFQMPNFQNLQAAGFQMPGMPQTAQMNELLGSIAQMNRTSCQLMQQMYTQNYQVLLQMLQVMQHGLAAVPGMTAEPSAATTAEDEPATEEPAEE